MVAKDTKSEDYSRPSTFAVIRLFPPRADRSSGFAGWLVRCETPGNFIARNARARRPRSVTDGSAWPRRGRHGMDWSRFAEGDRAAVPALQRMIVPLWGSQFTAVRPRSPDYVHAA